MELLVDYITEKIPAAGGALSVEEPSAAVCYGGGAVIDGVDDWVGAGGSGGLGNFSLLKYFNDEEYCKMIEEGRAAAREGRYHPNAEYLRLLDKQLTQFERELLDTAAKDYAKEKTYSIEEVSEYMLRAIDGNSQRR